MVSQLTNNFSIKGPKDSDSVLTGTTMKIYRFLVTSGKPIGPRELQKKLNLSSPAVASFHLEKLLKNGLAAKNNPDDGTYVVDRIYLKHFILLRRHLVPRYFFYALLSTLLDIGWLTYFRLQNATQVSSSGTTFLNLYGPITTTVFAVIFWYETWNVIRNEKI